MTTISRLYDNGNLEIKGIKITQWDTYDDTVNLDDTYQLDDAYMLDDTVEASTFFNYLFNITSTLGLVDMIGIDDRGYLFTAGVNENALITNPIQFNSDNTISIKGTLTESVVF